MLKIIKNNIYLLLMVFMFLFWIILQVVKPYSMTTGDTGAMFLVSDLIAKSFSIFPTDYYYPTEYRFFWASNFYAPLLYIFNDFNTVRIIANVLMYLLILLSIIILYKSLNIERKYAYLTMLILLIPVGNHYIYASLISSFQLTVFITFFFIIAFFIYITQNKAYKKIHLILYLFIIFYTSLNSLKTTIYLIFPLLVTTIFLYIKYIITKNIDNKIISVRFMKFSLYGIISALIAYMINKYLLGSIVPIYDFTTRFSIINTFKSFSINKAESIFNQIFTIYHYDNFISIISNISIYIAITLFIYILIYLLIINKNIYIDLFIYLFLCLTVEYILLIIFYPVYRPRYYYTTLIYVPIILIFYMMTTYKLKKYLISYIFIFMLFIHGSAVLYNTYTENPRGKLSTYIYLLEDKEINTFKEMINYFNNNDITYGYGYHDPAHIIYELSNGKIEAGSISFLSKCNITYMKWDTLHKYYDNNNLYRKSFFIVDKNYYNKCKDKHKFFIENTADKEIDKYLIFISSKGRILDYFK